MRVDPSERDAAMTPNISSAMELATDIPAMDRIDKTHPVEEESVILKTWIFCKGASRNIRFYTEFT